ncbi:MAG: guanylate cyclase, partial [Roseiarcus sp.]
IAEPNGVCLSSAAYEQVRDKLKCEFVDLGEKELKNIARPVRAFALPAAAIAALTGQIAAPPARAAKRGASRRAALIAACGVAALAAGWFGWRSWSSSQAPAVSAASDLLATAPRLSLVVLPFENLSGDPEQEYFADGITDDLTTDLSHLPDSFVIARNTAFTYKGKAVDVKQLGRELGVRYVLEGSVRRVGEKITANAQLISTETGAHIWADRFDGERSRLGELQVEFVARLANSLGVELVKAESLRALRERPNNLDAVDLAMRGTALANRSYADAIGREAIDDFERALKLDPDLPAALIGLSFALSDRVIVFMSETPAADIDRAGALASRALAQQPDGAQAQLAKSMSLYAGGFAGRLADWDTVIAGGERAIVDDRNYANAYAFAGFWKVFSGRAAEGFAGLDTALRLSPRDPSRPLWEFFKCHLHTHLAQWDQAIEWCRKSMMATGSAGPWTYADLAAAFAWTGRNAEAHAAVAELLKLNPNFTVQTHASVKWTDNPTFNAEYRRIEEGLRKAGLPEGGPTQ